MRRSDKAITDKAAIEQILEQCQVCHVAMAVENQPYLVAMNYGYCLDGEKLTLYFHCATQGKKLEMMRKNPSVFFEMDCGHALLAAETACGYSYAFQSLMGDGEIEEITLADEKEAALTAIMHHYTAKSHFDFSKEAMNRTTLLKLSVRSFTAKGKGADH